MLNTSNSVEIIVKALELQVTSPLLSLKSGGSRIVATSNKRLDDLSPLGCIFGSQEIIQATISGKMFR